MGPGTVVTVDDAVAGEGSLEITIDALDVEASSRFSGSRSRLRVPLRATPLRCARAYRRWGPRVLIQQVDAVATRSRVHLDLRVQDPAGQVRRLESLGATVERVVEEAGTSWTVMADPSGTPFCVCPARAGTAQGLRS